MTWITIHFEPAYAGLTGTPESYVGSNVALPTGEIVRILNWNGATFTSEEL